MRNLPELRKLGSKHGIVDHSDCNNPECPIDIGNSIMGVLDRHNLNSEQLADTFQIILLEQCLRLASPALRAQYLLRMTDMLLETSGRLKDDGEL